MQDMMPPQDTDSIANIVRRLRMVEESHANTRRKLDLNEQNNLREFKKAHGRIADIITEIDELRHDIRSIKDDMVKIIAELQNAAKKEDVQVLTRYLEFFDPMKYVTQKEIDGIVDYAIKKHIAAHRASTGQHVPVAPVVVERKIESPPVQKKIKPTRIIPDDEMEEQPDTSDLKELDTTLKKSKDLDELL